MAQWAEQPLVTGSAPDRQGPCECVLPWSVVANWPGKLAPEGATLYEQLQAALCTAGLLGGEVTCGARSCGRGQWLRNQIRALFRQPELKAQWLRCQAIEGVDCLAAAVLVAAYASRQFSRTSDFLGLLWLDQPAGPDRPRAFPEPLSDGRVMHPLLLKAARAATRKRVWRAAYRTCLAGGMTEVQALKWMARRLCRIAFALMETEGEYLPPAPGPAGKRA